MSRRKNPEQFRSFRWFGVKDLRSFGHRSRLYQMGYDHAELANKPVIAIINTWSDINPCHAHLRARAEEVKRGVWQAGGFPIELPAMSLAETYVKPTTMLYRNFLAMEVEELIRSHPVDGVVLLAGCDKTTPGTIMGAIQVDLPTIFVPAGPMLRGNYRGRMLGSGSDVWKYWAEKEAGRVTDNEWSEMERGIARSFGTCMTMGTASTMTALADTLGLSLPGASAIPAADAGHARMAALSGARIVEMVFEDLKPSGILTAKAFENALAVHMAMAGSTNAMIHLIAIARRCGVALTLDDFDRVSAEVPVLCNIRPTGEYLMEDFYYAGGLIALWKQLKPLLHTAERNVIGTIGGALDEAEVHLPEVIRPLDRPVAARGGTAILKGNLAPQGCVMKPAAADPHLLEHPRAGTRLRQLRNDDESGERRGSRRHRRHGHDSAQCGPGRRTGHAGMGHAADPEKTAERGRTRHGAHFRRPHERHQLRCLCPSRCARSLCRRTAGGGAQRRYHRPRRRPPHDHPRSRRGGDRAAARRVAPAGAGLLARLPENACGEYPAGAGRLRLHLPAIAA
ncbi:dihydroxyacid dehydratase/phosphogluconate dehydratase [Sinorhizobium medicae]